MAVIRTEKKINRNKSLKTNLLILKNFLIESIIKYNNILKRPHLDWLTYCQWVVDHQGLIL